MEAIALCLLLNKCGLFTYRDMNFFLSTQLRRTGRVEVQIHPLTSIIDNVEWLA